MVIIAPGEWRSVGGTCPMPARLLCKRRGSARGSGCTMQRGGSWAAERRSALSIAGIGVRHLLDGVGICCFAFVPIEDERVEPREDRLRLLGRWCAGGAGQADARSPAPGHAMIGRHVHLPLGRCRTLRQPIWPRMWRQVHSDFQCDGRKVAGGLGFEPRLAESESAVLPLDDPPTSSLI